MLVGRRHLRIAHDDKCFRDDRADGALLAGFRNRQTLEQRVVPHGIRRLAVRHLPGDVATIEIDRRQQSVRRLHDWQALDLRSAWRWSDGALSLAASAATGGGSRVSLRRVVRAAGLWSLSLDK